MLKLPLHPLCAALALFCAAAQGANFTVNTALDVHAISPLIYGYNAYADGTQRAGWANQGGRAALQALNPTARRLGGNAMTSYNWENGVNNSGDDWCHSSNAGMSTISGAGEPNYTRGLAYYAPGAALVSFHDQSLALGTYSLLQLPGAGKLPKDIVQLNPPGVCKGAQLWQDAPGRSDVDTARWLTIVNDKPAAQGPLSLQPSLSDGVVYIDEALNFLTQRYGKASTTKGIKGYELDNEPDLWHHWPDPTWGAGTHERLYPQPTTVGDVFQKNVALATTVKRMDASAQTFGPAVSGYLGLFSLWAVWDGSQSHQPADWANYNQEPYLTNRTGDSYRYNRMTWANAYLATMQAASTQAKQRLLDAFSFHYYPQASATANDRVQAPRSLWDASYVEPSWITQAGNGFTDGRGLQLIPKLRQAVQDFYPGTRLAITEYDFGGKADITGAIAQADALGIFGREGVYLATYFGDAEQFIASGFKIYRNYDGKKSSFPTQSVRASSSDNAAAAIYAAIDPAQPGRLNLVVINRQATAQTSSFSLTSTSAYQSATVWGVSGTNPTITARKAVSNIQQNKFSYTLPARSVLHFVLQP